MRWSRRQFTRRCSVFGLGRGNGRLCDAGPRSGEGARRSDRRRAWWRDLRSLSRRARRGALAVTLIRAAGPLHDVFLQQSLSCRLAWPFASLVHDYNGLALLGVRKVQARAVRIDPVAKSVGAGEPASRIAITQTSSMVAPGIDLKYGSIEGYGDHTGRSCRSRAWKAGAQTSCCGASSRRCPERRPVRHHGTAGTLPLSAGQFSLVAAYFMRANPRSKILVLDAKDSFSEQC